MFLHLDFGLFWPELLFYCLELLIVCLASCIGKEPKDLKGKIVTVQLNDFKNRYGEDLTRQSSGASL